MTLSEKITELEQRSVELLKIEGLTGVDWTINDVDYDELVQYASVKGKQVSFIGDVAKIVICTVLPKGLYTVHVNSVPLRITTKVEAL